MSDNWISVEERLPEDEAVVQVWYPPWNRATEGQFCKGYGGNEESYWYHITRFIMYGITHWQPLPAPPMKG